MHNKNDIEKLFKSNFSRMLRVAVAILHDEDIARDIIHGIFASLMESTDLSLISTGYLVTTTKNRCLNHIRDLGLRQRILNRIFIENEDYEREEWPDEETINHINEIIQDQLSEQSRKIIELRFEKGMKFSEIATVMGISETAVYRHLSNGLNTLRKNLNKYE